MPNKIEANKEADQKYLFNNGSYDFFITSTAFEDGKLQQLTHDEILCMMHELAEVTASICGEDSTSLTIELTGIARVQITKDLPQTCTRSLE